MLYVMLPMKDTGNYTLLIGCLVSRHICVPVKRSDVLALIGLILMAMLYIATLLILGGTLLYPTAFNDLRSLYLLLLVIFIFSTLYYWTSPTFPLRRNRPVLVFMGVLTTISFI